MAKKKKPQQIDIADSVSELLEFAEKINMPEDALELEVADECRLIAAEKAEQISEGALIGQLEFLLGRGWSPARLRKVMEEMTES